MKLETQSGTSLSETAQRYGLSEQTARNYLDVAKKTSDEVLETMDTKGLTFGHVRAISTATKDASEQEAAAALVASEGLTTADTYALARVIKDIKRGKSNGSKAISVGELRRALRSMRSDLRRNNAVLRSLERRAQILIAAAKRLQGNIKLLNALKDSGIEAFRAK